ncbi:MAG TPA: hypothetical protein VF192_13860 [Longimicrobiales bacterium]
MRRSRRSGLSAAVPALALVLTLAASARASCPSEIPLDEDGGTMTLIGSYETQEQFSAPLWTGAGVFTVSMTLTRQVGVYMAPDGARIDVECTASLSLG